MCRIRQHLAASRKGQGYCALFVLHSTVDDMEKADIGQQRAEAQRIDKPGAAEILLEWRTGDIGHHRVEHDGGFGKAGGRSQPQAQSQQVARQQVGQFQR